jgi:Fe-S-cluster containining protein
LQRRLSARIVSPILSRPYRRWKKRPASKSSFSVCRACIASAGGCCVFPLSDGWKIILLPAEVQLISEYTGKAPSEFIDTTPLPLLQQEAYNQFTAKDPLWSRLFSLWTQPSGFKNNCPFIQSEGCFLPYEVKPFLCRVYPLDFNITDGNIFVPVETDCLLLKSVGSINSVLACFDDDWGSLQGRFEAFRHDFLSLLNMLDGTANKITNLLNTPLDGATQAAPQPTI